jgi:hypothetical protein
VKNGNIFVLSIELAEKVLERTAYDKTITEENKILRQRLLDLQSKITFAAPPDAAKRADATTESPQKSDGPPTK